MSGVPSPLTSPTPETDWPKPEIGHAVAINISDARDTVSKTVPTGPFPQECPIRPAVKVCHPHTGPPAWGPHDQIATAVPVYIADTLHHNPELVIGIFAI